MFMDIPNIPMTMQNRKFFFLFVFPEMLGDRSGNGSAVEEELMNSPGFLYLSPLDIPDHPIDQIHYDSVE